MQAKPVASLLTTEGDSHPSPVRGRAGGWGGPWPSTCCVVHGWAELLPVEILETSYLAPGGGDGKVMRDNGLRRFLALPAYAFMHDWRTRSCMNICGVTLRFLLSATMCRERVHA